MYSRFKLVNIFVLCLILFGLALAASGLALDKRKILEEPIPLLVNLKTQYDQISNFQDRVSFLERLPISHRADFLNAFDLPSDILRSYMVSLEPSYSLQVYFFLKLNRHNRQKIIDSLDDRRVLILVENAGPANLPSFLPQTRQDVLSSFTPQQLTRFERIQERDRTGLLHVEHLLSRIEPSRRRNLPLRVPGF